MFGAPSSCALRDLSGNPEETLEEELQPKQQREMFKEAKETHSGSEHVGVSVLETPTDERPSREQALATDVEELAQEHSITKDRDIFMSDYSPNLQAAMSCCEENPSETLEERVLLETKKSDVVEMESRGMLHVCSDDAEVSCNISEHQVDEENKSAVPRSDLQRDPQSKEEADKDETEETSARPQGAPAPGKKKKKKKRAKRKGGHEEGKRQANQAKCSQEINTESTATGDVPEPVIDGSITKGPEEVSTDRAEDEQDRQESCTPNEATVESVIKDNEADTSETDNVVVEAPTAPQSLAHVPDHALGGKNHELNVEVETVEAAAAVEIFETPRESRTEAKEEERDDGAGLQTGSVERDEAVGPNDPTSDLKPSAESRTAAGEEQQGDEETPKTEERSGAGSAPEESFSSSDRVLFNADAADKVCVAAVAECLSERGDRNHAESGKVEEDGHVAETNHNCTNMEAEKSEGAACVLRDHSVGTKQRDGQGDPAARPPPGDGSESSSSSEPPSQPSAGADSQDEVSKEGDARSSDGEDGGEESSPPTLEPQPKPAEELKADLREAEVPSEPSCSSGEEKSESLAADVDAAFASEKSLEAAETQAFLCKDQNDEAFSDTSNASTNPDSPPAEALHQWPGDDHRHGKEEPATLEDSPLNISQNNQLSGPVTDSCEGRAPAQPNLQESGDDDDDERGQSFDFDDIDVEMAVSSDPVEDEKCAVAAGQRSDTRDTAAVTVEGDAPKNTHERQKHPPEEEGTGLWGGVTENLKQAGALPVEEGVDALQQLQGGDLVSGKSPDLVVRNTEPPQASKEVKKNSKKGKAKGKEDCKMS